MKKLCVPFAVAASLVLSACGSDPAEDPKTSQAEEFAARINGTQQPAGPPPAPGGKSAQAQAPVQVPRVPYTPGTAEDPKTACNASLFQQFLGQQPSADVRKQIMKMAEGSTEVRFIAPGSPFIKPDPTNPRLNVMIAIDGVIRDIRCG